MNSDQNQATSTTSRRRLLGWLLPFCLLSLPLVLSIPAQPAQAATQGKLVLLLDSSGSMKEKVGSSTKISIAKRALRTVVNKLPADAQAGMRVYGATVFDRKDKGACTDSQLIVPIGTANRAQLRAAIAKYKPYGETPISYSLKQAARDLGGSGRRTVVLVSDGEETCNVDPCDTAAQLTKQGIDLKFDVIGLHVSGKARTQLQCIADRGNGTYYDADNAEQIENTLDKLATRAFRPFKLSGTPIQGSTDESAAPTARPGQYVDHFPGTNDDLYYRIPRTMTGSTIHVGFTAESDAITGNGLFLYSSATHICGNDTALVVNTEGSRDTLAAEADTWSSDVASECNTASSILVKLSHQDDTAGHPFELLVREEPPVTSTRGLPPAELTYPWQSMSPAQKAVTPPVPGSGISDAPVLSPGTYRTSILTGEKQVFGVNLGWGQRLQVEAVVPPRTGALAKAMSGSLDALNIQLISPLRGDFVVSKPKGMPEQSVFMNEAKKTYRVYAGTPTVTYLNRAASGTFQSADLPNAALPGRYTILLNKSRGMSEGEFLVPYTLVIKVIGTAGTGAPTYRTAATSPTSSTTPSMTPNSTPSSAVSPGSTDSPSTDLPSTVTPSSVEAAPTNGSGTALPLLIGVPIALLVIGGLVAAVIGLVLTRRRG